MSKNPKNGRKLMKITYIDSEILHIFWTTWGNSIKLSGKMCFKIILKVRKNQSFSLSVEDTILKKPQGEGGQIDPPPFPVAVLGLSSCPEVFCKKSVLGNPSIFTEKHMCWSVFLIKLQAWGLQLYQKETPAQVFSREFCEIF